MPSKYTLWHKLVNDSAPMQLNNEPFFLVNTESLKKVFPRWYELALGPGRVITQPRKSHFEGLFTVENPPLIDVAHKQLGEVV